MYHKYTETANIPKREAVRVKKYKCDPNSKDEFIEGLQDESTLEKMANLFSDAGDSPSEQSVNGLIESFTNLTHYFLTLQ